MVIWTDPERAAAWERLSDTEQAADARQVEEWYEAAAAGGLIQSGEELAWPRDRIAVRRGPTGPVAVHLAEPDASVLGGVMVVEVDRTEAAIELARGWPDLRAAGDRIDLYPIRAYDQD
jgi:hypothetical protein